MMRGWGFRSPMMRGPMMGGRGLPVQSRVLSFQVIEDNEEIVARLRQPAGSKLIRMERLRSGAGEPFALETGYLAYGTFKNLQKYQLDRRSLYDVFQREYHLTLAHADDFLLVFSHRRPVIDAAISSTTRN